MNFDVLEKLKDYVSTVEDYVLSMYSDDVESFRGPSYLYRY